VTRSVTTGLFFVHDTNFRDFVCFFVQNNFVDSLHISIIVTTIVSDKKLSPSVQLRMWLGGVAAGHRIRDREVASSIPGCSAAKCNSGQVVHTRVPLFTKQYKLVPASLGVKCTTGAVLDMLAAIRRTLRLAANRRHSSIVLTCGCRCTAALK